MCRSFCKSSYGDVDFFIENLLKLLVDKRFLSSSSPGHVPILAFDPGGSSNTSSCFMPHKPSYVPAVWATYTWTFLSFFYHLKWWCKKKYHFAKINESSTVKHFTLVCEKCPVLTSTAFNVRSGHHMSFLLWKRKFKFILKALPLTDLELDWSVGTEAITELSKRWQKSVTDSSIISIKSDSGTAIGTVISWTQTALIG